MRKWLIPLAIALGFSGVLVYQLVGEGAVECKVCVTFKGQRRCATGIGPSAAEASQEAHRSACARMASGVTDSFACPNRPRDEETCSVR
jgi:hypothetical protein